MRLLLVDDDTSVRTTLFELFKEKYDVVQCGSAEEALPLIEKTVWDLVITDNKMGELSGLDLIKKGKILSSSTSFVLVTAYASVEQAVEAIQIGADDYVMKPFDLSEMEHRVSRIENLREWKNQSTLKSDARKGASRLIGKSKNIEDAKTFVEKVADVPSAVLILGPTGSGKEVLAQAIHEHSKRAKRSFVAVNCASLNEQLMESELFGHEKGAFTGANAGKPGKFELATGGTIFLDEIGELSQPLQAKLLRVLQEKEFCRVGGVRTLKSEARVIVATNRDLKKSSKAGEFREDLYFRLNVLAFQFLPLAKRREDILPLTSFFWEKLSRELGRKTVLSEAVQDYLKGYIFPGNIRELYNALERLMVLGPTSGEITPELLPPEFVSGAVLVDKGDASSALPGPEYDLSEGFSVAMEKMERQILEGTLKQCGNNQVKAAALLKMPRGTFQSKLQKLRKVA